MFWRIFVAIIDPWNNVHCKRAAPGSQNLTYKHKVKTRCQLISFMYIILSTKATGWFCTLAIAIVILASKSTQATLCLSVSLSFAHTVINRQRNSCVSSTISRSFRGPSLLKLHNKYVNTVILVFQHLFYFGISSHLAAPSCSHHCITIHIACYGCTVNTHRNLSIS